MATLLEKERDSLEFDLSRNHLFLTLEARIRNPASRRSRPRSETLLSAYVTLSCGRLEYFFRRSFSAAAANLREKISSARDTRLGENFYWNNLNGFIQWSMKAKNVDKLDMITEIESFSAAIVAGAIHPPSFSATDANPNAQTLKTMFSRLGIGNSFSKISRLYRDQRGHSLSKDLIETNLNTFVRRRNQAAHEGRISGATREDIQKDHVFVLCLSAAVTAVLQEHIDSM